MKNNSFFITAWLCFYNTIIKNSLTYRWLLGLYNSISKAWRESFITNIFRRQFFSESSLKNSLWSKICFSPFSFLEKVADSFGEKLVAQKEKSHIVKFFKYFLHNCLALNLRFLGVLIFFGALSDLLTSLLSSGKCLLSLSTMIFGGIFFDPSESGKRPLTHPVVIWHTYFQ